MATWIVNGEPFSFPAEYADEELAHRDEERGPIILTRILTRDGEVPPEQLKEFVMLRLGAVPVPAEE